MVIKKELSLQVPGVSAKNGFGSCVGFDPYHCAARDDWSPEDGAAGLNGFFAAFVVVGLRVVVGRFVVAGFAQDESLSAP